MKKRKRRNEKRGTTEKNPFIYKSVVRRSLCMNHPNILEKEQPVN